MAVQSVLLCTATSSFQWIFVHKGDFEMKTTKTRIIFFTIALTYNLILGFYLREFLVLSPTLQVFYMLSALPTLFLAVEIKTKAMRAVVYILLILIACMNIAYAIYCRRVFSILAIISLGVVFMYFVAFANARLLPSPTNLLIYGNTLIGTIIKTSRNVRRVNVC